ncbi:MAG: hypothetical protein WBX00_19165 [Isosphaeraceae bacterium]
MADTDLRSVIVWFESAEQMLMAVLDVIPYEAVHENVWSPRLVTVLLETCSQLDSLLKQQAVQSPCVASQNLNITDYFALFGQDLSGKWVLFWGESPEKIRPFGAWQGLAGYDKASYPGHELKWWKAYNKIKHNRIENRREATLRRAVEALGGLFLAILYCEICRDAVGASGWLQSHSPNPKANLDDHLNPMPDRRIVAESKLFSYPVGWMKRPIKSHWLWSGAGSDRFNHWFNSQAE